MTTTYTWDFYIAVPQVHVGVNNIHTYTLTTMVFASDVHCTVDVTVSCGSCSLMLLLTSLHALISGDHTAISYREA